MSPKINTTKIKKLHDELEGFLDEIDTSDAEWTQVLFKERVSNLIREKVLKTDKLARKLRLSHVLELALGTVDDQVLQSAETFDNAISSYDGEPDEDEMIQAFKAVTEIVRQLKALLGTNNAN